MLATLTASNFVFGRFHAAERIEFHFEEMTIPIEIDELILWNKKVIENKQDYLIDNNQIIELAFWLNILGFESRAALSEFLANPFVKDKSMELQLLRSWAGRKLLDKISDLAVIDNDKTAIMVFNTLEKLLEEQKEVSLLDLMKELPSEVIHFDLDELVNVLKNWRKELQSQQKLITDLRALSNEETDLKNNKLDNKKFDIVKEKIKVKPTYRSKDMEIEIWRPLKKSKKPIRDNWILFMPGLGGEPRHFHWLAKSLSQNGWEIVLLNHPGSDTKAMNSLLEGINPFPNGIELFPYRLADLRLVLDEKERGILNINGKNVVLMGHSLGALNAFLASGSKIQKGLIERCNDALDDFSITNISRLIQCQLIDVPLSKEEKISSISAIVGINSFGKLLWPQSMDNKSNIPVFLTGGTFDLITPAISEQLGLLLSTNPNSFSRVLIIEGASHFSPINVEIQEDGLKGSDVYQISDDLVGAEPAFVQDLLSENIINFLESLETKIPINLLNNHKSKFDLKYHILDYSTTDKLLKK